MRERGGRDLDVQVQVGGAIPGGEVLHQISSKKKKLKLISLISLFREVMEVMGSWKLEHKRLK